MYELGQRWWIVLVATGYEMTLPKLVNDTCTVVPFVTSTHKVSLYSPRALITDTEILTCVWLKNFEE